MNQKLKEQVFEKVLKEPAKSDYTIAKEVGVSRSLVYTTRMKFIRTLDYELAKNVAGAFLSDFQQASDYFKLQITSLENKKKDLQKLKNMNKTVFRKTAEGQSFPEEVELEASDLLAIHDREMAIEKQQTDLWKNIMFLARQGEAVEIMKLIQNGRIQPVIQ